VPAYVSIAGAGLTPLNHSAVAFAGPAVNLLLFALPFLLIRTKVLLKKHKQYLPALVMMSRINLFLFIFNMLPIPMFDGWSVYSGIIHAFV
jgi:Zn-dependent protease